MLPETAITTHYRHADAPLCAVAHGPLQGLRHRTVIDRRTGAASLALWHEEHEPAFVVPPHRHDCEEIITVLRGEILATVEGVTHRVAVGESVLIPAFALHAFEVSSAVPVRLHALFASPEPRVLRPDGTEAPPPWEGGAVTHLEPEAPR